MDAESKNKKLMRVVFAAGLICYIVTFLTVGKHVMVLDYWEYEDWGCDYFYATRIDRAYKWITGIVALLSPASGISGLLIWGALGSIFFGEDSMKTSLMAGMIVCSMLFWGVSISFGAFEEDVLRLHPQASIYPALSHTILTIAAFAVLAVDKKTKKTKV